MQDTAVNSGEFYTSRPVERFMEQVVYPRLGETVLGPACGKGRFLVEVYTHPDQQAKTVEDFFADTTGGEARGRIP